MIGGKRKNATSKEEGGYQKEENNNFRLKEKHSGPSGTARTLANTEKGGGEGQVN